MRRNERIILIAVKGVMMVFAAILLGVAFAVPEYTKYGGILASFLLPFVWDVVGRTTGFRISFGLELLYLGFLAVALFLGIDLDLYRTVPGFDKIIHLISGFLAIVLGDCLLNFFRFDQASKAFRASSRQPALGVFRVVFLMSFSLGISVLWEFFEFGCDRLLGQRMQQLVSIGVGDTMFDMLAAFGGAVLGLVVFRGKKG